MTHAADTLADIEVLDLSEVMQTHVDTPLWNRLLDEYGADRIDPLATGWPPVTVSLPPWNITDSAPSAEPDEPVADDRPDSEPDQPAETPPVPADPGPSNDPGDDQPAGEPAESGDDQPGKGGPDASPAAPSDDEGTAFTPAAAPAGNSRTKRRGTSATRARKSA